MDSETEPYMTRGAAEHFRKIRRTLRFMTAAMLVLFAALLGISVYVWTSSHRNTQALCALRNDLQRRVDASEQFLRTHPNGVDGITAGTIRVTISGQKQTIKALHDVPCPAPPGP